MPGYHHKRKAQKSNFSSISSVHNRCCNPMKIDNHNRTKALRGVTQKVKEIYPHLTSNHKICSSCRIKITKSYKVQEHNTPEGNCIILIKIFLNN